MTEQNITAYQAKYFANYLSRRLPANDLAKLTASLQDAQVDLTPHQIEAALFAFQSPLSKGAILADEVGLGKTIEAGIILSQNWAEHDYIFTTTQFLTAETIDRIQEAMGEEESLLICCTAYQKEAKTRHSNITVKKIPKMLLGRCAFDKDNYNLNIVAAPAMDDIEDEPEDDATI